MNTIPTPTWMTMQDRSQEFRWLERDGKLVLQVACPFQHQYAGGFEWRDIPIVREEKTSQAVSITAFHLY